MKKILLLTIVVFALLLAGCGAANPTVENNPVETEDEGYALITPEDLMAKMNEGRDSFLLINTHIPFEGNIPTTDLFIPHNNVVQNLSLLPEDKDAELIIYCMSNRMAYYAADALVQAGYTNLRLLDGGMIGWYGAGLPIVMEP